MSYLNHLYRVNTPPIYDEVDELELALQEAYEAGLSDGYNEALNEGVMDKLRGIKNNLKNKLTTSKNWIKNNKGKIAAGAIGAVGLGMLNRKFNTPRRKVVINNTSNHTNNIPLQLTSSKSESFNQKPKKSFSKLGSKFKLKKQNSPKANNVEEPKNSIFNRKYEPHENVKKEFDEHIKNNEIDKAKKHMSYIMVDSQDAAKTKEKWFDKYLGDAKLFHKNRLFAKHQNADANGKSFEPITRDKSKWNGKAYIQMKRDFLDNPSRRRAFQLVRMRDYFAKNNIQYV